MTFQEKLINSFPTDSKERIKMEIGILTDAVFKEQKEVIEKYIGLDEYVFLITDKITSLNKPTKITISYPFGEPVEITYGVNVLRYEQAYMNIKFLQLLHGVSWNYLS